MYRVGLCFRGSLVVGLVAGSVSCDFDFVVSELDLDV